MYVDQRDAVLDAQNKKSKNLLYCIHVIANSEFHPW